MVNYQWINTFSEQIASSTYRETRISSDAAAQDDGRIIHKLFSRANQSPQSLYVGRVYIYALYNL